MLVNATYTVTIRRIVDGTAVYNRYEVRGWFLFGVIPLVLWLEKET